MYVQICMSFLGKGLPARWYIFIQILAYFWGPRNGTCWYILWYSGIFNDHLVYVMDVWYFVVIWYIFSRFGMFYKKIWHPCLRAQLARLRFQTHNWFYTTDLKSENGSPLVLPMVSKTRWKLESLPRSLFRHQWVSLISALMSTFYSIGSSPVGFFHLLRLTWNRK
jgi:hypothetical protein